MKTIQMTKDIFKDKVMDYTESQDWNFKGERPAVIDFYATWCGPCKMTAPVVEEAAEKYDGEIDFYKVDVDQEEELAALFGIRSIPTLLFIPVGGQPKMKVGAVGRGEMEQIIQKELK